MFFFILTSIITLKALNAVNSLANRKLIDQWSLKKKKRK